MEPYYQDDSVTLYHGDCYEHLDMLAEADCMITDPPYEIATEGGGIVKKRGYADKISTAKIHNGFDSKILATVENCVCFLSKKQLVKLLPLFTGGNWNLLSWHKLNPIPAFNNKYLPDTEFIIHRWAKGCLYGEYKDKFTFKTTNINTNGYGHPTVKPDEVMRWLVSVGTDVGQLICDPFAGTGSTLRAAKDLGRRAVGFEINEKYCEIAAKRLEQGVLF